MVLLVGDGEKKGDSGLRRRSVPLYFARRPGLPSLLSLLSSPSMTQVDDGVPFDPDPTPTARLARHLASSRARHSS
jgi:hypothetical protein